MASMSGLLGSSQAVLEGSFQLNGSTRLSLACNTRVNVARSGLSVRAQQGSSDNEVVTQNSRRSVLGLVATGLATGSFVQAVLAEAKSIKLGGPPPPSGGLPGTDNSDEARDLDLPLKNRFFLQPKSATEASQRVKESAKEILNVKQFIEKKAWPFVQNDLRSRAQYLRFDLNTVIASKPKEEKAALKELTGKLFQKLDRLDYAAKKKSPADAAKYYGEAVTTLNDVLAKIG
ncbi:hypothetical protein GIB67_039889 [Kingdonia uniflora]|uniref:Photosystem II subunit Q-2 n=1 Tax=Kingdonia uniflora TaxID=39325 RepID=A0A7J7P442_9MAGN|nr:hypothetical protein GIB67_039889 [Kingdonia uniflora]